MSPALGVGAAGGVGATARGSRAPRGARAPDPGIPVATTASDTTGGAAFGLVGGLIGAMGALVVLIVGGAAPIGGGRAGGRRDGSPHRGAPPRWPRGHG